MTDIHASIILSLRRLNRPIQDLLQEGLSVFEINKMVQVLPFRFPPELIELYSWKNGTKCADGDLLDDLHFFPGFYFMSLEEALSGYLEFEKHPQWNKFWFPFFANGGGDFYATDSNSDELCPKVLGFLLGEEEQSYEYQSVTSMMKTIAECYAKGAYYLASDGTIGVNDDLEKPIGKMHNPNIEYWN